MEAGVAHPEPRTDPAARTPPGSISLRAVGDYVALTKPRVVSLLLLTTACSMVVADPHGLRWHTVVLTLIGGYLAAGGAGAFNHVIERDLDARMGRTAGRPVATGRVSVGRGLVFATLISVAAMAILTLGASPLAAGLALCGLLGYVLVYTLWLKPSTPQNIVIGGAAGAFPPLVGWAAATGGLELQALWLFAIVFFWTPPHFWALALLIKGDYARGGVPMMPVVRGEEATRRLIAAYSAFLALLTLGPVATGLFGAIYAVSAVALGAGFVALSLRLRTEASRPAARRLYLSSLAYLALLFCAMVVDRLA